MTNKEKAREMAEEYRAVLAANTDFDVNDLDIAEEDATMLVLEMAEWKDQQFKEEIEQLKDELDALNMRYLSQVSLYKSLYQGLVDKACEWIMTTPMYAKQPSSLVEEFRKAMEYERTESKNDTQG